MAPLPPPYHPALDCSWRALLSALLELFTACLILITTGVTLLASRLVKFFELPHPCTYIGLQHDRSLALCDTHRRLALVRLEQQTCVDCLQAARNQVLPLYSSEEQPCRSCYGNKILDVQDKLLDEDGAVKKSIDGGEKVNGKGGGIEDETGLVQRSSSVVWCDRKSLQRTGDRCVKRKFSKFSVEERRRGDHEAEQGSKAELRLEKVMEAKVDETDGDVSSSAEAAKVDVQTGQQATEVGKTETSSASEASVETVKAAFQAEKDALGSLYKELEEERNAAAIAANEAMAMITRLQEEKAAVQMEARQYQRMVDEKAEYDQEAITLLKEILLKREQEKYVLEKEVESYRKTVLRPGRDNWDFYEDKVPFPLTFRRTPSEVLYLEGGRKRDDLEVLRGINLLENFDSASGDRDSPRYDKLLKPLLNDAGDVSDDRLTVAENGGLHDEEEDTQNETGANDTNSALDLRTTSMVMRDNFRLAMEADIRELTSRLQVLEDDRNAMHQMAHTLKMEKQELRELAQNLRDLRSPSADVKFAELLHEEGALPQVSQVSSLSSKKRRLEQQAGELKASNI